MTLMTPFHARAKRIVTTILFAFVTVSTGRADGAVEFALPADQGRSQSVTFDSKLTQLAALQPSGDVLFYDLRTGTKVREWKTGWVKDETMDAVPLRAQRLEYLGAGQRLLVASGEHIGVFDVTDGRQVRAWDVPGGGVRSFCVSKDGKRAVAQCGNTMTAWNLETGATLFTHTSAGYATPRRSRTGIARTLGSVDESTLPVSSRMAFTEDGSTLALGLAFEAIDLWSLDGPAHLGFRNGSSPFTLSSSSAATAVGFLQDGRVLGVFNFVNFEVFPAGTGAGKKIIDQAQPKGPEVFEMHALAVSSPGQKIVLGGIGAKGRRWLDPTVPVYDQPTSAEVRILETTGFQQVARYQGRTNECVSTVVWDDAGKRLAIVSGVGYTDLWTGTLQQSMRNHGGMLKASTLPLHVRVWTP